MGQPGELIEAMQAVDGLRCLCDDLRDPAATIASIVADIQLEHHLSPSVGVRLERIADEARRISQVCSDVGENLDTRSLRARVDQILACAVGSKLADQLRVTAEHRSSDRGLAGTDLEVRSFLKALSARPGLILAIGGEPRRVVTADTITDSLLRQARIAGEAIAAVWEHEMLESGAAAVALGAKPANREKVRSYRERSWLIGLPHGRGFLYPRFQFDVATRQVFAEVREVNEILRAAADPWGVASWWIASNDRVGCAPLALVGTDRSEEVVRAANALLEPVG